MIQNEFEHLGRAMAKATCKRNACFVVHSLYHRAVILSLGSEVVEQKIFMGAKHARDLFHGLKARTHRSRGPCFHVSGGPSRIAVLPKAAEAFLEFPSTGGRAERGEHGLEFVARMTPHLGAPAQQEETSSLGACPLFLVAEAGLLATPHSVHGFVEMFRNVERIEHVEGSAAKLGHDLEIGFPHVGTHDTQPCEEANMKFLKVMKPFPQSGFGAALSDPQKPARTLVDLIDESQKVDRLFTASVVEFVDSDGGDTGQVSVFKAPMDHPLHRAAYGIPTRGEDLSGFLPRQPPGPAGNEDHVGFCIGTLAPVPRHGFHGRGTINRTDNAARRICQRDGNVPERHVMPPALWKLVVHSPRPAAAGTSAFASGIGIQLHFDARLGGGGIVANGFHDKTGKVLHMTQECFNGKLNGGCGVVCCFATPSNARGRHSQVLIRQQTKRVLPRKTHIGNPVGAKGASRSKRNKCRRPSEASYAGLDLDAPAAPRLISSGGEFHPIPHKFC